MRGRGAEALSDTGAGPLSPSRTRTAGPPRPPRSAAAQPARTRGCTRRRGSRPRLETRLWWGMSHGKLEQASTAARGHAPSASLKWRTASTCCADWKAARPAATQAAAEPALGSAAPLSAAAATRAHRTRAHRRRGVWRPRSRGAAASGAARRELQRVRRAPLAATHAALWQAAGCGRQQADIGGGAETVWGVDRRTSRRWD